MKKILLKSIACLSLLILIGSCSNDENTAVDLNESASKSVTQKKASYWDGVLGVDRGSGVYQITVDPALIIADFENILQTQGTPASLNSLNIVRKVAANNSLDSGYMMIGSSSSGTSIGVMLQQNGNSFYLDPGTGGQKTTTCRGCATGCNLEYYNIDGKKIPYCNENGCIYDCTKIETTF
jgi:hypothetical protein